MNHSYQPSNTKLVAAKCSWGSLSLIIISPSPDFACIDCVFSRLGNFITGKWFKSQRDIKTTVRDFTGFRIPDLYGRGINRLLLKRQKVIDMMYIPVENKSTKPLKGFRMSIFTMSHFILNDLIYAFFSLHHFHWQNIFQQFLVGYLRFKKKKTANSIARTGVFLTFANVIDIDFDHLWESGVKTIL